MRIGIRTNGPLAWNMVFLLNEKLLLFYFFQSSKTSSEFPTCFGSPGAGGKIRMNGTLTGQFKAQLALRLLSFGN